MNQSKYSRLIGSGQGILCLMFPWIQKF
jgi:hypothetical protein